MRLLRLVCLVFVCLAATAWGQNGSPWVYVAGGSSILRVTSAGAVTTLLTTANANYQGLVVGPDNVAADNPAHPFLLYACDPAHNTVVRFDPEDAPANGGPAAETVYSAGALQQPQCGRLTSTGDLIVTSNVAGSGVWKIANVENIGFGAGGFAAPTQDPPNGAFSGSQVSQGIAQKNIGDLLIVDTANNEVIRSQYATGAVPFSAPPTVFITPSATLSAPFGIARKSGGDIFISNQSKKNQIQHYSPQGAFVADCVNSLGSNITPKFMQMSSDDTLYVAADKSTTGFVYSINASTCAGATQLATGNSLPAITGIALPPTSVSQTQTFAGTTFFNFGFAGLQYNSPSCTLTVTASQTTPFAINQQIAVTTDNNPNDPPFPGGTPAVNLGADGFEYEINATVPVNPANGQPDTCEAEFADGTTLASVAAQIDNSRVDNPRLVSCLSAGDPGFNPDIPSCTVVEAFDDYPLGGLLPDDLTTGGRKTGKCNVFLINENLGGAAEPGQFCGFESPLTNVAPPGIAGTFSSGATISLKFKLATANGSCQNGPYVSDAVALISVAQLADSKGNQVFNEIDIGSEGSSTPTPPTFKIDTKNQYQFSLSLKGYAKGTYSITLTFLTNNTFEQTVLFQVD